MKKFLVLLSFTIVLSQLLFAQTEQEFQTFKIKQHSCEMVFINFIKQGKVDSCLKYISYSVQNKYGYDSLKREFLKLYKYYRKYPHPTSTGDFGQSTNGVGSFGHNTQGKFEKQSTYQFIDAANKVVYYFTLYYSDREPISTIRFYESKNLSDYKMFDRIQVDQFRTKAPGQ